MNAAAARIQALATENDRIPSEVQNAYVPSGRSGPLAVPKMILLGFIGVVIGVGVAYVVKGLATWVFGVFDEAGSCLTIVYYPAVFAYYLSPLAVPFVAAALMAQGAEWGRNRSVQNATLCTVFVGLVAAALVVWMEIEFAGRAFKVIVLPESLWVLLLVPVMSIMTSWFVWVVALGLGAGSVPMMRHLVVDSVRTSKFCESCEQYLTSSVLARYPVDISRRLLTAILGGDWMTVAHEPRFSEKPADGTAWTDKHERLELTLFKCSCGDTTFVDGKCYWGVPKDEGKIEANERLVHSFLLPREDSMALQAAIGLK